MQTFEKIYKKYEFLETNSVMKKIKKNKKI